ncbi:MAG TPA: amidohydrolase family protein [Acidimicrobiales bacterium]|nr:amidohydrolase family protein [Acidimicrobiales bacterium]
MTAAAALRAQLGHPVIDADGHVIEFLPAVLPYLRESLGPVLFERYRRPLDGRIGSPPPEQRHRTRAPMASPRLTPLWDAPSVAASLAPRLFHERLPELGIDFAVLYPTHGLGSAGIEDEDLRRGTCAGFNAFYADAFAGLGDRLAVAGLVPMHTPEEALAELEHCARVGLKVVALPHGVVRPIVEPAPSPWLLPGQSHWVDTFGLDSAFDYDRVWSRCAELGFAVTVHGGVGMAPVGWYTSVSSFSANHIGSFMSMTYPTAKSIFMGGVTRRFPRLPFAFQECGVWWAAALLADTVEHWERFNREALATYFDRRRFDLAEVAALVRRYAPELAASALDDDFTATLLLGRPDEGAEEWDALDVSSPDELVARFTSNFFFGCESDDRLVAQAFAPSNPLGCELRAMLGSDISHPDTPDLGAILPNAFRLVEEGLLTGEQFERFTFGNARECFTRMNPRFFDGTAIGRAGLSPSS